ncbi:hypothetical protein [Tardiphaga sp. P9-11]|jgi:hypothetical protein|uniref:hypothetical protein n=1 Tax=Tardiphaga sp. P9-11 TaxID=2024614 RepID=UPI001562A0BA|nr:hypothetical protein [Tardiphaga sp. P9-11]
MKPTDNACRFLDSLSDLSTLVRVCRVSLDQLEVDDGFWGKDLIEMVAAKIRGAVRFA